jgi:hypothetical protein
MNSIISSLSEEAAALHIACKLVNRLLRNCKGGVHLPCAPDSSLNVAILVATASPADSLHSSQK